MDAVQGAATRLAEANAKVLQDSQLESQDSKNLRTTRTLSRPPGAEAEPQRPSTGHGQERPPGTYNALKTTTAKEAAIEGYRAATSRGAPEQSTAVAQRQAEATKSRDGLRPEQPKEIAPIAKDFRETARAAYAEARTGAATGKEPEGVGKSTGNAASKPSGRGGSGGR